MITLNEKCEEHDKIEFVANVLKFNNEIMDLNVKYCERIEELRFKNDELLSLYTTERNLKEEYKNKIDRVIRELNKYMYYVPEDVKNEILVFLETNEDLQGDDNE